MYSGALGDAGLSNDPFTGSRYAFGGGNPISNVELDGHTHCDVGICPTQQQTEAVTQRDAAYGAGCPYGTPGCPGWAGLVATRDAAANLISNLFNRSGQQGAGSGTPSLGDAICQGLIDLCSLPSAIANIPNIPSEAKKFGQWWLAGWRAGWSNKPVSWNQGGNLNVTMPSGTVLQFAGIAGASGGMIPKTGNPLFGDYPDLGQTTLYMINDPASGQILKFGITNDPAGRYSAADFRAWNSQYGGQFQMDILHNFDTRSDALYAERYLAERVGGPENFEDWANTVPNDFSWEQVLKDALSSLPEEEG